MDQQHLDSFFNLIFEKRLSKQAFLSTRDKKETRRKFEELARALADGLDIEVFKDATEKKRALLDGVTDLATDMIRGKGIDLTESEFWQEKQRLLELQKKSASSDEHYEKFIYKHFKKLIYKDFGIVGGAFAIADKSNEEIIYIRNKHLQTQLMNSYSSMPFIEIPNDYSYSKNHWDAEFIESTVSNRNTLDAIFIGNRERQRLVRWEKVPPDFYVNLPGIREKINEKKLLPFERELTQNGLKVIYCTVGEVLFFLYAWRLLFRHIQQKGLKGNLQENDIKDFKKEYKFWDCIKNSDLKTPERDWLKTLNDKHKGNKEIHSVWNSIVDKVDCEPSKTEGYTFYDEYFNLGIIDEKGNAKREYLSLIQYLIFVSKEFLGCQAPSDIKDISKQTEQNPEGNEDLLILLALEEKLSKYLNEPQNENNTVISLSDLRYVSQINDTITRIVKKYLLKRFSHPAAEETNLETLLEELHKHSRFPIIPYYYELAVGNVHNPKEHLGLCLWESNTNQVDIKKINGKEVKESGVAFVLLSLLPIWHISDQFTFIKNGRSIHTYSQLSAEAYSRIFRIYDFFRTLVTPIVDQVFYGNMIKSKIQRETYESDYSNFSHEISKVTNNIFNLSNVPMNKLFKGEYLSSIANVIRKSLSEELTEEEISKWLIIPFPERFQTWSHILHIWSGRRSERIFTDLDTGTNAYRFVKECNEYARKMHVGSILSSSNKPEDYSLIKNYNQDFLYELLEVKKQKKLVFKNQPKTASKLGRLKLKSTNGKMNDHYRKDTILLSQNIFTRLLIACLTNIYEHTTARFFLEINVIDDVIRGKSLHFKFVNPSDGKIKNKEQKGTEPVLSNCLNLLNGIKYRFDFLEENEQGLADSKKYEKHMHLPSNGGRFWVTEFSVPIKELFTEETN